MKETKSYQRDEFTLDDALRVQKEQILKWKPKIVPELYKAIWAEAHKLNKNVENPYRVFRGSDIDNFIHNWEAKENEIG